ncbi:hypothetical protein [Methylocystis sp. ATCC 49242]|uniref:hypothetical protein n=1 Tax=Methylocystis sp. ATCC 49242 TaxID=622637 RepID=UPI0001F87388|nr:hypothetical protein [Methylocystis sp. ATCC 49242]
MGKQFAQGRFGALVAAAAAVFLAGGAMAAEDADEAELLKYFEKVDVWHFPVDTTVRYNNQDAVVTRELVFQPPASGELCYVRFDVVKGEGDYGFGLKPATAAGPRKNTEWGINVLKRGTVLNQWYSALRMNVIYFFVEGPKAEGAKEICARKQAAPTAQAGNAYQGPWSDLVTKAKAIHGWPATGSR